MNGDVIIVESKSDPETFFIFRPLMNGSNEYVEIKFNVDFEKKLIKCSRLLHAKETKYIRDNIIDCAFKIKESILNYDILDYELNKPQTYSKLQ